MKRFSVFRTHLRRCFAAALFLAFSLAVPVVAGDAKKSGEDISVIISPADGGSDFPDFRVGDPVRLKCYVLRDGRPAAGVKLRAQRRGDDGAKENTMLTFDSGNSVIYETVIKKPGFARIDFTVQNESGRVLRDGQKRPLVFRAGVGAGTAELKHEGEPADFDAFWARQKEFLGTVPLAVTEKKPVPHNDRRFLVYDVRVACFGRRPVSGYLVVPAKAKERSLGAEIRFQGYSPNGVVRPPAGDPRRIIFQINAHGIENGFDNAYYREKYGKGELKDYGFSGNEDPEKSYFRDMILRALRAVEYVKTLPEWDGSDLAVSGGSQGGFQAIAAAALDPRVNRVSVSVPWMCDLGGFRDGRMRGWLPSYCDGLAYYDTVSFGKRLKCRTSITAGLGDDVCSASGVMTLYNELKCPKSIVFGQGGDHSTPLRSGVGVMSFCEEGR